MRARTSGSGCRRLNPSCSARIASTIAPSARFTSAFDSATACGGNDAMRRASRSTKGQSSSGGSARFTHPYRSAVAASKSSLPRMISSARLRPARRASRCVPVPPGRIPSATSGWLNTARPRAANRMSQDSVNSLPPPPTRPSITAMVAFGMVRNRSTMPLNPPSLVAGGWSAGMSRIPATSACAMKKSGFAERNTTTRTSSSASSRRASWANSRIWAASKRFTGGWSITTVATPSATVTCSRSSDR